MSVDRAAQILVDAIKGAGRSHAARQRRTVAQGTVTATSPLTIDLHGSDLTLDADDLTVPPSLRYDLFVPCVVTLNQVAEGDFHVVAIQTEPPEAPMPT